MSSLSTGTQVSASLGSTQTNSVRLGAYNFYLSDSDHTSRYVHMKTNCVRGNNAVMMVEAIGYNYSSAQPIRCAWTWYSYSVDLQLYTVSLHNIYPGLVPHGVYYSSDGYVCIRSSQYPAYYLSFTLDAYYRGPDNTYKFGILAASANTTAGAYY